MTSPPPPPRPRHRLRRALLWVAGAVVLYTLAAGIVLPVAVLPRLESALSAAVGRPVSIRRVRIDPFLLAISLEGVAADDPDGAPFLRCETLSLDLELSSLLRRAIVLREVRLSKPYVHAIVDRERRLNLAQLPFVKDAASGAEASALRLVAEDVEVDGGDVLFTDLSRPTPFQERFAPMHVAIQHFSTLEERAAPYAFRATTADGDDLEWEGLLSLHPFRSEGRLHAVGTLPETVWRYLQDTLDFQVGDATVEVSARYALQRSGDAFTLSLGAGEIRLENLSLTDRKSREVVLGIPRADVAGATFDLASRRLTVASFATRGGTVRLLRNEAGALGIRQLFVRKHGEAPPPPPAGSPASGSRPTAGSALDIRLAKLAIEDYRVEFEDRTTTPPVKLEARKVSLRGTDLSSRRGTEGKLDLGFELASGGQLEGSGTLSLDPPGASVDLSVQGLGLQAFQPYLDSVAKLDIAGGTASLHGRLTMGAAEAANAPWARLRYEGRAALDQVRVARSEGGRVLVGWTSLGMDGAALAFAPDSLSVEKVVCKAPELHLARGKDGRLDTSWWIGLRAEKTTPDDGTSPQGAPARDRGFPIRIASLKIEGGTLSSWDASVEPPVRQTISRLDAAIEGFASPGSSPFRVHLKGQVNGAAPLAIQGAIGSPLNAVPTRVELKMSNYGLTTLNPYATRYLGQAIDRGKLAVTGSYRLERSELQSDNHLVFDQLALGKRVESPNAGSPPLGLAMALLRNRRGEVALDVSVHGDINTPGFSYRDAFGRALANVITKVASTPFAVLGSLVGEGPELGYVVFSPGSDALEPEPAHKVDALAQALEDRPELRIEVRGTASATLDQGTRNQLLRLAQRRAVTIRRRLEEHGIDAGRVYLLEPALRPAPAGATDVRTELSLTAG
jgi:hypothetical protein